MSRLSIYAASRSPLPRFSRSPPGHRTAKTPAARYQRIAPMGTRQASNPGVAAMAEGKHAYWQTRNWEDVRNTGTRRREPGVRRDILWRRPRSKSKGAFLLDTRKKEWARGTISRRRGSGSAAGIPFPRRWMDSAEALIRDDEEMGIRRSSVPAHPQMGKRGHKYDVTRQQDHDGHKYELTRRWDKDRHQYQLTRRYDQDNHAYENTRRWTTDQHQYDLSRKWEADKHNTGNPGGLRAKRRLRFRTSVILNHPPPVGGALSRDFQEFLLRKFC